jgi:hypothetical protein
MKLNPADMHDVIVPMAIPYSEKNMEYAQSHSVDGIVKTKEIQSATQPHTRLDAIEAQTTYTAMMTDTLLED